MFQVNALAGSVPSSVSVPSPLKAMTSPARKTIPSCGDRIVAVGALPTVMVKRRRRASVHAVGDGQPHRVPAGLV